MHSPQPYIITASVAAAHASDLLGCFHVTAAELPPLHSHAVLQVIRGFRSAMATNYWRKLINPDKSPSPILEQLCFGIAKVVSTLDSSFGTTDLTPDRLAAFYRQVGGNYDSLFLETSSSALSFIYQSLGCFHSLQPTTNAFERPSIPALLPNGFLRWLTIQILLDPDEHCQYLQKAVAQWDIADINGKAFPKEIPRDAFPSEPDPDMVEWHQGVCRRLEDDYVKATTPQYSPLHHHHHHRHHRKPQPPEDDYFSHRPHHHHHRSSHHSSDTDTGSDHPPRSRHRGHHAADNEYGPRSRSRRPRPVAPTRSFSLSPRQERSAKLRGRRFSLREESPSDDSGTSEESQDDQPGRPSFSDVRFDRARRHSPHHRSPGRSHSHDPLYTSRRRRHMSPGHPGRYDDDAAYPSRHESRRSSHVSSNSSASTAHSNGTAPLKSPRRLEPGPREYVVHDMPSSGSGSETPRGRHHRYAVSVGDRRYLPSDRYIETNKHSRTRHDRAESVNYASLRPRLERWTSLDRPRAPKVYVPPDDPYYSRRAKRAAMYN